MDQESEKPFDGKRKYIHIQGFVSRDKAKNFLFPLASGKDATFKISTKLPVSQEVFQTNVGRKPIQFANLFIPYSAEAISVLKEGTGRFVEEIIIIGPDKVPGGKPPGVVDPPVPESILHLDFRVEISEFGRVTEVVVFKAN
ncbi:MULTISPECIES: hypothetical protein [unclassified Spirosoma]|uniref:hypothetical protein n=1 Tax=unclassified Spirosoma TaxID=2621999 RepID=UPI00095B309F|nr:MULTISPECIES: hypothetical protein [unclassified Spirosoma]MBN8825200.1 hypothetical protein [Spirosoma sp.]OJW75308.1 MAG: hypothetical protein BGO59_18715 [Spirosoma sp. 48-14]